MKSIKDIKNHQKLFLGNNIKCIYHHVDFDGICSAAIVHKFINENISKNISTSINSENKNTKVSYSGFNYGMKEPNVSAYEDSIVVCCDVFVPNLKEIVEASKLTIWIDHHLSSMNDMKDFEHEKLIKVLSTDYAACMGVWKFFYNDVDSPKCVKFLSAYDSHHFDDSDLDETEETILEFQYGMKNQNCNDFTGTFWSNILDTDKNTKKQVENIKDVGKIIYAYIKNHNNVELMNRASYTKELITPNGEKYNALVLNAPYTFSKTFDSKYDKKVHDILICFYKNINEKFQYSFYCPDDKKIDCSAISKQYGGGGHPGAAGCIADTMLI